LQSICNGMKFNLNYIYNCYYYYEIQYTRSFGTLKIIFLLVKEPSVNNETVLYQNVQCISFIKCLLLFTSNTAAVLKSCTIDLVCPAELLTIKVIKSN
jgi:hypothetical protein